MRALMRAPNEETERGRGRCWRCRAAQGRLGDRLAPNEQPMRSVATGMEVTRWLFVVRLSGKAAFVKQIISS